MKRAKKETFVNPLTGTKHRSWEALHRAIGKSLSKQRPYTRGSYDEITRLHCPRGEVVGIYNQSPAPGSGVWGYPEIGAWKIVNLFRPALEEEYVQFDKKGRGSSLNHDLYGYDPAQGVAVVQARQAFREHKNDYLSTHKTYFLVGRNEITGEYFRHPVSAHAVRAAIRKDPDPSAVVRSVQRWMWEVTEAQLAQSVRQGDLLLVPEKRVPDWTESKLYHRLTVAESHEIRAEEIRLNGRCYALNPTVVHTKGQHAPVAVQGWVSIRVARAAQAWDFAARIGD